MCPRIRLTSCASSRRGTEPFAADPAKATSMPMPFAPLGQHAPHRRVSHQVFFPPTILGRFVGGVPEPLATTGPPAQSPPVYELPRPGLPKSVGHRSCISTSGDQERVIRPSSLRAVQLQWTAKPWFPRHGHHTPALWPRLFVAHTTLDELVVGVAP